MAILQQTETIGDKGHLKTINESGIMMIFDTLQRYQYAYPIKSTTREIISNGVDSISEKKVAIEILSGRAKVEDYFVNLEGDLYKDSHFDPSYYNLDYLGNDNRVRMTYYVGGNMEKDKVVFEDHGVGLGGKRLEGYFQLAYSTKRLSKLPLGKFGLGAKSPLSVGVDFYTVESRYNGMLFRFNIYSKKVDSIIPRMNMESGQENPHTLFNEGTEDEYPVYYLPTTAKNGVTITIEAKKHHKQQYIDAVKSQLLYFDDIELLIVEEGLGQKVPYKANILYEDDLIVMSDNNYYSKPHLLLNKVNYGYVNWDELELEDKNGNIGIKVAPEDIDVNPSRESVLWTEKTKQKVLDRFNEVVDVAASMIQKELQSTDFLQWVRTCYSVYSKYSERQDIVGRLSKIVDLNRAKFRFGPNPVIQFLSMDSFPGLFMRLVEVKEELEANRTRKRKVIRTEIKSIATRVDLPIYLMAQGERASNLKDKYLYSLHPQGFITVMEPFTTGDQAVEAGYTEEEVKKMYTGSAKERVHYWNALSESAFTAKYEQIEVPDDFKGTEQEVEEVVPEVETEEEKRVAEVAKLTAEERRKASGKTLVYGMMNVQGTRTVVDAATNLSKRMLHVWNKMEVPIASINEWDAEEIYYGHEADSPLMSLVEFIVRDPFPGNSPGAPIRGHAQKLDEWKKKKWWRLHNQRLTELGVREYDAYQMQSFFDTKVMLVKMSQSNARYYRDFRRIEEFFIQIQNKTITMSNQLIKWNTARLVKEQLAQCAFLYNFPFNTDYQHIYNELRSYVDKNYREVDSYCDGMYFGLDRSTYTDMVSHLDKVKQFQDFVQQNADSPDTKATADLASVLFGNAELTDGMAVDPAIMRVLTQVIEFVQACGPLLNCMPLLTGYATNIIPASYSSGHSRTSKTNIPEEVEHEIRNYLEYKGVLNYGQSPAEQEVKEQIDQIIESKLPVSGEIYQDRPEEEGNVPPILIEPIGIEVRKTHLG